MKDKEKFAPGRGIHYRNNLLHLRSFQHFAIIFPVISTDLWREVSHYCFCQLDALHFLTFDLQGWRISFKLCHCIAMIKPKSNKALPRNHNSTRREECSDKENQDEIKGRISNWIEGGVAELLGKEKCLKMHMKKKEVATALLPTMGFQYWTHRLKAAVMSSWGVPALDEMGGTESNTESLQVCKQQDWEFCIWKTAWVSPSEC